MSDIAPEAIETDVQTRLVNSPSNPDSCFCGRYVYYSSVCTHLYQEVPIYCGSKTVKSGKKRLLLLPSPEKHCQRSQDQREVQSLLMLIS